MGQTLGISLKLNFTPNTLVCYGLTYVIDLAVIKVWTKAKHTENSILNIRSVGNIMFCPIQ